MQNRRSAANRSLFVERVFAVPANVEATAAFKTVGSVPD
jgi:hypothetical protein